MTAHIGFLIRPMRSYLTSSVDSFVYDLDTDLLFQQKLIRLMFLLLLIVLMLEYHLLSKLH